MITDKEPTEHPCHLCGDWFPAVDLVPYTQRPLNDPDDERVPVAQTLVYCLECDRVLQNEGRELMIAAGLDPDENKERFRAHDAHDDADDAHGGGDA